MSNMSFPTWAAPIVGTAVGAAIGLRMYGRDAPAPLAGCIAIGAAIGLFAGIVLWLKVWLERQEPPLGVRRASIPWVLLTVSPLLFCLPIVGAVIGGFAAYHAHRARLPNWLKGIYFILFLVSGVGTVLFSVVVIATRLGVRW